MAKHLHNDLIIDMESLGYAPDGIIIDLAAIVFQMDPENPPKFKDLVDSAFYVKFKLPEQHKSGRILDDGVKEWWVKQSPDAKQILAHMDTDVLLNDGFKMFHDYAVKRGVNKKASHFWSRGNAFDITLYEDVIKKMVDTREIFEHSVIDFRNVRDVRTSIESTLMVRDATVCPLPIGMLDGFVAHNAVHDCAKDIIMMIQAKRYALGLEQPPSLEDTIPFTIIK